MIRLLATDLDGTLLRPDGSVSPRTVATLANARDAGFPVVFVTGRPPRWMAGVIEATGHAAVAVCANGALLVDLAADTVLAVDPLAADLVLDLARELAHELPPVRVGVEYAPTGSALTGSPSFGIEPGYPTRVEPGPDAVTAPMAELVTVGPVVKLLVRSEASGAVDPDELLARAVAVIGSRAEATHSSPRDPLLEISATGVDKASGLARYAAELGVASHEVAAVGDMPNDLSMLAWAGASYAVHGSHPRTLAATTGRVAVAADDGVADLLAGLLAEPSLYR